MDNAMPDQPRLSMENTDARLPYQQPTAFAAYRPAPVQGGGCPGGRICLMRITGRLCGPATT